MPRRFALVSGTTAALLDYEEPPLQPGQVRVRVEIATVKHGTNLSLAAGSSYDGWRFDPQQHLFKPVEAAAGAQPRGFYGAMGAGEVIEVGADVSAWQVGDRVFGVMDARETNVCAADRLWALGDLEPTDALCLEAAYVAFHSLRESGVRVGDRVAVVGLGAIGLLAVRLARLAGAAWVVAVDPLPRRREVAAALGADLTLDPTAGDVGEAVHSLGDRQGVDVAIEVAGQYRALQDAIRTTRVGGTVCLTGFYQGEANSVWFGREAHHNRLTFVVPHGCGWANLPRDYPRWDEARANETMIELMRAGRFTAPGVIDPIVPFEQAPEAWRWVVEEPARVTKLGLRMG